MPPTAGYSNCKKYLWWYGYPELYYWYGDHFYDDLNNWNKTCNPTHWAEIEGPIHED